MSNLELLINVYGFIKSLDVQEPSPRLVQIVKEIEKKIRTTEITDTWKALGVM